jgi:Tfp pilus assembly protein PilF
VLHYKQGNLFLREKKVALAIDELKKAVAINPSYGVAYRSLGVAYMLLGREKSAVKSYERFVATEPSHRDVAKVREIIADYYRRNPR